MERIIDIKGLNGHKIYPFSILTKRGVVNDSFSGIDLVIFYQKGSVSVLDEREISKSKKVGSASLFSAILETNRS